MTFLLEVKKKMLELFRNRMNKIFLRKGVVLHYKYNCLLKDFYSDSALDI